MVHSIKGLITLVIVVLMQTCAVNLVESTPAEAAGDFLDALKKQDPKVMEMYMDNDYVNFLCNAEGDAQTIKNMNKALFDSFTYEVIEISQKNNAAVAKVKISARDFSKVMDSYQDVAYDYIMENLYDEDIGDKKKLNEKCLELYVSEIEKVAEKGKTVENIVLIPMVDNGYHGWSVLMTDELMESILGNLEMPAK